MKFVDYHVHSNFSCDGKSTLFQMSQRAIDLGIEEIGFSDHMDFEPKDWGFGLARAGHEQLKRLATNVTYGLTDVTFAKIM